MFTLGQHPGSPYMRGSLCWIVHSAAELRNVPYAHLAIGEAHAMPIHPSGMPRKGICYDTIIKIMAHFRPSNNIVDLVITKKNR